MFAMPVRRVVLRCVFTCGLLLGSVFAADAIPQPIDLGTKDVAAYLVAPDLNALLNNVEAIAKQVAPPDKYQPGMLRVLLGMSLGDPTLANLGTKPFVVMVFKLPEGYDPKDGPPPMALFVPANAASPYDEAIKQADANAQTVFADGVLIVAPDAASLTKAQAAKDAYAKITAAKPDTDLRIFISATAIVDAFGAKISAAMKKAGDDAATGIKNAPPPPNIKIDPDTIVKLAKMGLKGAEGMLHQLDSVQYDLKVRGDNITLGETLTAKPDTLLAEFLTAGNPTPVKNIESLVGKGSMQFYAHYDPKAHQAAFKKLQDLIKADPDFGDLPTADIYKLLSESQEAGGGEAVGSIGVKEDGSMSTQVVATVTDKDKYLAILEETAKFAAADGLIGQIYKGMGIDMDAKFEKAARQHAGVDVHRTTMTMAMKNMPPQAQKQMDKWLKPTEVAIVKDIVIQSNDPATLDSMIDAAAKGDLTPNGMDLKSRTAFGPHQQMYFDYDFIGLLKGVMAGDPNNPVGPLFAKLTAGSPLLFGLVTENGRVQLQGQIPVAPIAEMVKQFGEAAKAVERGAPPKKPEKDDGKF